MLQHRHPCWGSVTMRRLPVQSLQCIWWMMSQGRSTRPPRAVLSVSARSSLEDPQGPPEETMVGTISKKHIWYFPAAASSRVRVLPLVLGRWRCSISAEGYLEDFHPLCWISGTGKDCDSIYVSSEHTLYWCVRYGSHMVEIRDATSRALVFSPETSVEEDCTATASASGNACSSASSAVISGTVILSEIGRKWPSRECHSPYEKRLRVGPFIWTPREAARQPLLQRLPRSLVGFRSRLRKVSQYSGVPAAVPMCISMNLIWKNLRMISIETHSLATKWLANVSPRSRWQ